MTDSVVTGYDRGADVFGIRNHIVVMSSVSCANSIVEQIGRQYPDVVMITHQHGCTQMGDDREQVRRTLSGICHHPNVAGVLVVGLGCETISAYDVAGARQTEGRLVKTLVLQEVGDRGRILNTGRDIVAELRAFASTLKRVAFDAGHLTVGLECGGSDPFSGITANPAVGLVSDRLVELGATVMLAETPEMIGAEPALKDRIPDEAVRRRLFARIDEYIEAARRAGGDLRGANPTPGNIRAGLSTIEEKSLGCIIKGGHSDIVEFVEYAHRPTRRGLVVVDTPGNDAESVTGMVAGGAHLVLFTTGVGTPLGSPVAPVVKISTNTRTYEHMRDFIDIDAGTIITGRPMAAVAQEIFDVVVRTCHGTSTAAEANGCREFAINRIGTTF